MAQLAPAAAGPAQGQGLNLAQYTLFEAAAPIKPSDPCAPRDRKDYKTKATDFAQQLNVLIKQGRDLLSATKRVWGGTSVGDFNKTELNSQWSAFFGELVTKRKQNTASVPRNLGKKRAAQARPLFYISDQLRAYLTNSNYGNGLVGAFVQNNLNDPATFQAASGLARASGSDYNALANAAGGEANLVGLYQAALECEWKKSRQAGAPPRATAADVRARADVKAQLGMVLNDGLATSGIIISLLSLIIAANNLQSQSNRQRFHHEGMVPYFGRGTNTRWIFNRTDLTPASFDGVADITGPRRAELNAKLTQVDISAIERIAARGPQNSTKKTEAKVLPFIEKGQEKAGTDDYGLLYSTNMTLNSFFHIPEELLTPAQRNVRTSVKQEQGDGTVRETNAAYAAASQTATQVQQYLRNLLEEHHKLTLAATKVVRDSRRKATQQRTKTKRQAQKAQIAALAAATPRRAAGGAVAGGAAAPQQAFAAAPALPRLQ